MFVYVLVCTGYLQRPKENILSPGVTGSGRLTLTLCFALPFEKVKS